MFFLYCILASADETPCTSEQTGAMTTSSSILYPKLHFSISLHKESGELHINIVEGNPLSITILYSSVSRKILGDGCEPQVKIAIKLV